VARAILNDSTIVVVTPVTPTVAQGDRSLSSANTEWVGNEIETAIANNKFEFTQGTPEAIWLMSHPLNKFPSVTVIDSAGSIVEGDVEYISLSQVKVTFDAGFSGKAYLN
jgi:uncharacterized protein with beta-barrel porin domain